MVKKDSELFKPLVVTAEKYLRAYCDGKQQDDEKAKVALRVLSVYRRILKVEKEKEEIKSEWEKLIEGVAIEKTDKKQGEIEAMKRYSKDQVQTFIKNLNLL